MLEPDVRRHLDGTPIAHVATVAPDGSPHVSPVWIGTHGDLIVFFTGPTTVKARNLKADPRVAISLTATGNDYEPVVIRGRVVGWLDGDEGWAAVDEIAKKYTGQPYTREFERQAVLVEPDRQKIGIG